MVIDQHDIEKTIEDAHNFHLDDKWRLSDDPLRARRVILENINQRLKLWKDSESIVDLEFNLLDGVEDYVHDIQTLLFLIDSEDNKLKDLKKDNSAKLEEIARRG